MKQVIVLEARDVKALQHGRVLELTVAGSVIGLACERLRGSGGGDGTHVTRASGAALSVACPKCKKRWKSKQALAVHMTRAHASPSGRST